MNKARIRRGVYICNVCKKEWGRKDIKLDHIKPVVDPKKGFTTWDEYIKRMFVDESGWQVLCDSCHDIKTAKEKEIRKKYKKTLDKKDKKR